MSSTKKRRGARVECMQVDIVGTQHHCRAGKLREGKGLLESGEEQRCGWEATDWRTDSKPATTVDPSPKTIREQRHVCKAVTPGSGN